MPGTCIRKENVVHGIAGERRHEFNTGQRHGKQGANGLIPGFDLRAAV